MMHGVDTIDRLAVARAIAKPPDPSARPRAEVEEEYIAVDAARNAHKSTAVRSMMVSGSLGAGVLILGALQLSSPSNGKTVAMLAMAAGCAWKGYSVVKGFSTYHELSQRHHDLTLEIEQHDYR